MGVPKDDFYTPVWNEHLQRWTWSIIHKNLWRVNSYCDREDLFQDGYAIYLKCAQKYTETESPAHFASLYRTAYINHINSISTKSPAGILSLDSRQNEDDDRDPEELTRLIDYNSGPLSAKLSKASPELKLFLQAFDDPDIIKQLRGKRLKFRERSIKSWKEGRLSVTETTNQMWCRIMGFDPNKINLVNEIREILK